MSIERAKVNCERCYGLANNIRTETTGFKVEAFKSNSLYSARNEAMRALEDVLERYLGDVPFEIDIEPKVLGALNVCAKCDYSSPRIVEVIGSDEK